MLGTMIGLGAWMLGASAIGLVATYRLDVVGSAWWIALPHPIGGLDFRLGLRRCRHCRDDAHRGSRDELPAAQ